MMNKRSGICPICGTPFKDGWTTRKYCSPECTKKAHAAKQKAWKAAHPRLPKVKVAKICPICGKVVPDRAASNVKYCSTRCAYIAALAKSRTHRAEKAGDRAEMRAENQVAKAALRDPAFVSSSVEGIVLTEKEAEEVRKALATPETDRWAICKRMNARQLAFMKRAYAKRYNLFSMRGSFC